MNIYYYTHVYLSKIDIKSIIDTKCTTPLTIKCILFLNNSIYYVSIYLNASVIVQYALLTYIVIPSYCKILSETLQTYGFFFLN